MRWGPWAGEEIAGIVFAVAAAAGLEPPVGTVLSDPVKSAVTITTTTIRPRRRHRPFPSQRARTALTNQLCRPPII